MRYLAALLLAPSIACADVFLTWEHPTTREDGTPLMQDEISSTEVYAADREGNVLSHISSLPAEITEFKAEGDCYRLATVDIAGVSSAPSPTVCKSNRPATPTIRIETRIVISEGV